MRVLYGGTFDPIHNGHLAVARAAAHALAADVYFMPAADPPHRSPPAASAEQRYEMLKLAISDQSHFRIDMRDLRRGGVSYAVETLREVRHELGTEVPVVWLIGVDAFGRLDTWKNWTALFELTHFVVVLRPGFSLDYASGALQLACEGRWCDTSVALSTTPAGLIWRLTMPAASESSTAIRREFALPGTELRVNPVPGLPVHVADFIRQQGLYRDSV